MKKIFVMILALCLAVPAISYAGSATSRWDLTIGGQVKVDFGWVDKAAGTLGAAGLPARDDRSGFDSLNNEFGNYLWGTGETNLSFFVRGPDAWGAKTSAFILGDFVGVWGGSADTYGVFDLVVANFSFDWKNTTLQIGMGGAPFGAYPTFAGNQLGWSTFGWGGKGAAPVNAQINITQRFTKELSANFRISNQNDNNSAQNSLVGGAPNSYNRSDYPLFMGGVTYATDACGKVGPWRLSFTAAGAWGQEKRTFLVAGSAEDDTIDMWIGQFNFLVPIIPEKNGNKTMALYVDGSFYTGQNMDGYYGGWAGMAPLSYQRPGGDFAAPVSTGGLAHAAFYFTDQLSINGWYWYARNNTSRAHQAINFNGGKYAYQYVASLVYDVNPAIRFVLHYDHTYKKYAGLDPAAPGLKDKGTSNTYRVGAFYYF